MNSYLFDIGGKKRAAARFIGRVRAELQRALISEKATRKLTQQAIAKLIGVNRSVINRQLMGYENMTLRSVAELAWALGWDILFELRKPAFRVISNQSRPTPSPLFEPPQAQPTRVRLRHERRTQSNSDLRTRLR